MPFGEFAPQKNTSGIVVNPLHLWEYSPSKILFLNIYVPGALVTSISPLDNSYPRWSLTPPQNCEQIKT